MLLSMLLSIFKKLNSIKKRENKI